MAGGIGVFRARRDGTEDGRGRGMRRNLRDSGEGADGAGLYSGVRAGRVSEGGS